MESPNKLAKVIVLMALEVFLLVVASQSFIISATRSDQDTIVQTALAPMLTPQALSSLVSHKSLVLLFSDEFGGNELDSDKWDVIKDSPVVGDGKLTLPGGATRAEIQSKAQFQCGVLQAAIESSDWKPQDQVTDSSFGFEIWTGANGQCHYGVIFIANGHLGVLSSQPDANNNCSGDPEYQAYLPISNWDAVRAAGTVYLTLMWSPKGVILNVSDGCSNSGWASYKSEANPTVPLEIRLNADMGETYRIDYVRVYDIEERTLLVDDFAPQPRQGDQLWLHNRLGGDRNQIYSESGILDWGKGVVTATITQSTNVSTGVWTALNHPIRDHTPINFSSFFPPQIMTQYQGYITDLQIKVLDGEGTFSVELKAQDPVTPSQEIIKWAESVTLTGGPQDLQFSLPITLGEVQNLNWLVTGNAGDFVVVDQVAFTATLPRLDTPERAFLWSYAMLLSNWDRDSGLTRDHAYFAANEFDNVSASGMQAGAAVMAWSQGFICQDSATEIVTKTTQALLALPRCNGLWPHFVENGQIVAGTEWSSIDTIIAIMALLEAREALGLETTAVEGALKDIDWEALILGNGSISMGYVTDCSQRLEDPEGGVEGGWKDFGTESWLVNLGYAAADGKVASFKHITPTHNGSGFIDELAWFLVPPCCRDRWGTEWCDYRQQAVDCQLAYYQCQEAEGADCQYCRDHPCYGPAGLFGLSAAEVSDLSIVPITQTYQAFGVGGEIPPNDGTGLLGHAVIVPHYAGMIASLRPTEAITLWNWIETEELFMPLNDVESFMFTDEPTCEQVVWNALKGSWNLSLQTLGWGRFLAGGDNPLYQGLWANDMLRRGYTYMCPRIFLPIILKNH